VVENAESLLEQEHSWEWMAALLKRFPLPHPKIHHAALPRLANL
jgi:hypothetical protein